MPAAAQVARDPRIDEHRRGSVDEAELWPGVLKCAEPRGRARLAVLLGDQTTIPFTAPAANEELLIREEFLDPCLGDKHPSQERHVACRRKPKPSEPSASHGSSLPSSSGWGERFGSELSRQRSTLTVATRMFASSGSQRGPVDSLGCRKERPWSTRDAVRAGR